MEQNDVTVALCIDMAGATAVSVSLQLILRFCARGEVGSLV